MSDNIKVVVKVRPLIRREIEDKLLLQWRVINNALVQIDQNGRESGPHFTFDKVYDERSKTSDVYNDIAKPIVEAATAGFNGTIFAYGQTSSGKTYTMTGTDESPGIIPLAVLNLFDIIKNVPDRDFLVRVSYVEIYNEKLIDLLNIEKQVKIHDTFQGVKVDATEEVTTSPEEVLEVMRKGKANRQTGATNMNDESSRSHSIFQITIESREHIEGEEEVGSVNVSQLNLVDLAGSERAGQTGATGLRFKEGTHINKSLSVLALVIKQLSEDRNKHVNYRDSKLTRILQNSLGGNAKTSIICAVTPAALEETISTLQFANRAKSVKNTPEVNAVATDATMIQSLTKELSSCKTELESKKNVEQDNFILQKRIERLQRLILNGFGQKSNTDNMLGGARRKLQQPRRVTISTLHRIQEDPVPTVPRFCTPSLKYNPMSLNTLPEFKPIQSSSSLSSVAEEPCPTTPPPSNKKVTISDEIIEIDSDDDNSIDVPTCSPYHGCFHSTKTPPCILKRDAKLAEKNLKDIVELTQREKLYTPSIVELMENLENKSLRIANLEEKIIKLDDLSKEKDKEMEILKSKISEAEQQIKDITSAKTSLEIACKDYTTKLTDWEVSYETLQKKAKTREEELLSLLQEHENKKKNEKIGKISPKALGKELVHFMDLSRDISLVNSDNENSIINIEEMHLNPVLHTNNDLETKLRFKNQTIMQLEANLHAQFLKIDSLEKTNKQFHVMISDFKDKISVLENENTSQILKIDNLNRTIESQKSANEKAMADIESYGNIIKELKDKLSNKEDTMTTHVSDSDLETMISNEELFIANNENMKNIIQTLKTVLHLRNEEIKKLKTSLDKESTHDFKTLEEELKCKKREISLLVKEIESLKEDHIREVNNFILTKNNLLSVEQQMKIQLLELRAAKEKETEIHLDEMVNLTKCKEHLTSELIKKEHDNETLQTEINKLSREVCTLKNDNKTKDNIIAELQRKEKVSHENLARVTSQLRNIIVLLSGKIYEVPQMIDNLVSAFGTLTDNLTSLEAIAKEIIKEKDDLRVLVEHHQKTFNKIKLQIDDLDNCVDAFYKNGECLSNMSLKNNSTHINLQDDCHENIELKMGYLVDKIKTTLECLNKSVQDKDIEIKNIKVKFESQLTSENTKHLQQIQKIADSRKGLLLDLLQKANDMASQFNIDSGLSSQIESDVEDTLREQITLTFDNIANNISILKSKQATKFDTVQEILSEAKKEILKLTEENRKMLQDISNLEKNNANLSAELKNIQSESKILKIDLKESNTIINELRYDLVSKTNEIEIIENKTKEWKNKFKEHELIIKEQIRMLQSENTELKTKYSELEMPYRQSSPTPKSNLASGDQKCISMQSLDSPPSLLTICCNRIIESIHSNENNNLESSSSTSTDLKNICQCAELTTGLNMLQEENCILKTRIKQLENTNDCLVKEQNEVQKEVQLLVENTQELQKKVVNHRTNLSTLTATTYAENKSLTSQIKFLQHQHNRFHNVCQKDIPALKNQLQNLMTLLKSENIYRQNESFKRYSLPTALDITPTHSKFKNDSISDCDLLMLDTNITLTTCDNTVVGHDQTCLDVTQVCTYNEVACQTSLNEITNYDLLHSQMEMQPFDSKKILDTLESLKIENSKLRDLVDEYSKSKKSNVDVTDKVCSPIKISNSLNETRLLLNYNEPIDSSCNCNHEESIRIMVDTYKKEITTMTKKLNELQSQKQDIELKYRDLTLEIPSTELLVQKLNAIEKKHCIKLSEITKISQSLVNKNEKIRHLQEENNILSNQVMETISELDDLKKEHDSLKEMNSRLMENCASLEINIETPKQKDEKQLTCKECKLKSEIITSLKNKLASESHIKLDRSYSDSDSSSRCNKICSLQNELHAGKEDCIELKEEVTTIKNHLDRSNLTISHVMELDDNIENSHVYCYNDFENIDSQIIKCDIPNITGESLGIYTLDKENCLNYYAEKTGANKESLASDVRLIDIMKMLYEYIEVKHANEVENLVNKLKDFEESKKALQKSLDDIKMENLRVTKELKEKNCYFETMANVVSHVRNNISVLRNATNIQDNLINFKENFLKVIDKEFGLSSTVVFELVIQQLHQTHTTEVECLRNDNTKLEDDIQQILKRLQNVNESCTILKSQLNEKENEFNLIQKQKEEVHNINAAVTLDIVKIEKELRNQIISGYRELIEKNILNEEIDLSLPMNKLIELLFELMLNKVSQYELMLKEKNNIIAEVDNLKSLIYIKDTELRTLTNELSKVQEINTNIQLDLTKTKEELNIQKSQLEHLNTIHLKKVEENDVNTRLIDQLTKEVHELKATLSKKQALVTSLEVKLEAYNENHHLENELKISQLLKSITDLEKETENLKSINEIIAKKKDNYAMELEKASAVIKQNKIDLDVMKETVKENLTVTDNLRREFETLKQIKDTLAATNKQLQEQIQGKCQNCSRLEMNVKTHEKTLEIQSRMIKRLQKQKEEDDKLTCEKDLKLDELTRKCKSLETDYEKLMNDMKSSRDEIEMLRNGKLLLEARITDLEEKSNKRRPSLEVTETVRRRRQSIHDSKRMFSEDNEEQAVLKSHSITEDVMDVDGNSSSRSTPVFVQRGRDSLISKQDQSEREEETARCSNVQAHRRRRQSMHDLHRSVRLTPDTSANSRESSRNNSIDSEVTQLKKQLTSCHKELEELKEKYREVDEECEICAEYLRERDGQCSKLTREKRELQSIVAELKEKLTNVNPNGSKANSFVDASINTDEDWTNLHTVVVDRMSYDAQVEKNKRLVKSIEELRYHRQDLRATVAKMQKALDKYSSKDKEVEAMRASLAACSIELEELRRRVKKLDDECETCAVYLRERDEQCRKLREANKALEAKLLQHGDVAAALRSRRQALHDQCRAPASLASDAATNTSDDLLTYHVEKDNSKLATDDQQAMELNRLKMALEKVSQQKTELEQQLGAAPRCVATGSAIVQNQQITDVMKENQKLKKMNAKLVTICKKRGKALTDNRENEQPSEQLN